MAVDRGLPAYEMSLTLINPTTLETQQIAAATSSEVDSAVQASHEAFATWGAHPHLKRLEILSRFFELLVANTQILVESVHRESGKTLGEARGEVAKGLETLQYTLGVGLFTDEQMQVSSQVWCSSTRVPLGVVVSIVPFNFPFMVPMWSLPMCLATGNTLVLKPSEKVPLTMSIAAKLFSQAGGPPGVLTLVNGAKDQVEQLVAHPLVKAVVFVGSSRVARHVAERCNALHKRSLCLGGAKNHLVAADDCDIDMTAADVVASFTGCAGQRCMAASLLLPVVNSKCSQQELISLIVKKAAALTAGCNAGQMGPVIDQMAVDRVCKAIADAEQAGDKILLDGRKWLNAASNPGKGYFVGPTIIHHKSMSPLLTTELFGPVLSILDVPSLDAAIAIENSSSYGNAACIYTRSPIIANHATSRFQSGMLGVNIGVPVPREPFGFGGNKDSKFGVGDVTGKESLGFFTRSRKVSTKWAVPKDKTWMD